MFISADQTKCRELRRIAVIMLQGRYAGRKAVIMKSFDEGTRDRPYGYCLVAGIKKYPKKVVCKDSAKKTAKKSRVKAFIKVVNYNHIMHIRYTLDVDVKDIVTSDAHQSKRPRLAWRRGLRQARTVGSSPS